MCLRRGQRDLEMARTVRLVLIYVLLFYYYFFRMGIESKVFVLSCVPSSFNFILKIFRQNLTKLVAQTELEFAIILLKPPRSAGITNKWATTPGKISSLFILAAGD